MHVRAKKAFTLIELLVVIGIIGVLVGIIVPSVHHAKEAGRSARCKSNLHGLGIAIRLYLNESDNIMPIAARMPSISTGDEPRIVDVLDKYIPGPELMHCPSDTDKNFFVSEGSSYEYNTRLGGKQLEDSRFVERRGETYTEVLYDYEPFHGRAGTVGAANYLFADMRVGDFK